MRNAVITGTSMGEETRDVSCTGPSQLQLRCIGKEGGISEEKESGAELVKDKKEGDRDRWNCDALHSIMLMRRIIMSSPQAVEADRVGVGVGASVSLLTLGFVCMRVHGKGREEKTNLFESDCVTLP